jgi:hypothetical protein
MNCFGVEQTQVEEMAYFKHWNLYKSPRVVHSPGRGYDHRRPLDLKSRLRRLAVIMKIFALLTGALATLTTAQTPAPYTDINSGITFNTFQHSSGMFFGLALPANATGNTDFIATIGGKGTGYSGVSLGGGMLGKLLLIAWPNQQSIISSFRKTV